MTTAHRAQDVNRPKAWTRAGLLLRCVTVAVGMNYAWELAQLPLYETAGVRQPLVHCFVASIGDGVMVLIVMGVVSAVRGSTTSLSAPRSGDYAVMLLTGLVLAVLVEWVGLAMGRWSYGPQMPRLPGTPLGVVPLLQMIVLPPAAIRIAASWQRGPRRETRQQHGQ